MSDAELLLDPKHRGEVSRVLRSALEIKDRDRHIMAVYQKALEAIEHHGTNTQSAFVGHVRGVVRYALGEVQRLKKENTTADHEIAVNPKIAAIVEECWRYWEQVKGNCGDDINIENQEFNVGLISSWVRATHSLSKAPGEYMIYEKDLDADLIFDEAAVAYLLAQQGTTTFKTDAATYVDMSGITTAMTEMVKILLSISRVRIILMNRTMKEFAREAEHTEHKLRQENMLLRAERDQLKKRLDKYEPDIKSTM
jgi:hypothetical protein